MDVTIPTSWKDINIDTYINLVPVLQTEQDEVKRVIDIICVLTGKKREEVREIKLNDYNKLLKKMSFLFTKIPTKLKSKRLKIEGNYYEFKLQAENLLFGEYINAMEMINQKQNNSIVQNLDKILLSICRPVERKFFRWREKKMTNQLLKETLEIFRYKMSIADAYPLAVFFCSLSKDLITNIQTSLMLQANQITKEVEKDLRVAGVGGHL